MRVCFVNTFDARGGAARAAFRIFSGIYALPGIEAGFLTREKTTGHPGVRQDRSRLTTLFGAKASEYDLRGLKRAHPQRAATPFSVNRIADTLHRTILAWRPDVIHLHWPHCGFLRLESLAKFHLPLVWTIHDMWAFTGVCHYAGGCLRYREGCGACPLLRSTDRQDISAKTFARKKNVYANLDLTVVAPSRWLADLARKSLLLGDKNIQVIPNGIDTELFRPVDRTEARRQLGLPADRILVLFGADFALSDPRKGGGALFQAFLAQQPEAELVIFGNAETPAPFKGKPVHLLGYIKDDHLLGSVYSACDLYAFPSTQDNLPNTVMEAMACGLPVLAYDVGGIADMISPDRNGFLVSARPPDMGNFMEKLSASLHKNNLALLGRNAREDVLQRFRLAETALKYAGLYQSLCRLHD